MTQQHDNSIIESGVNDTIIESGRVINVNMRRWTVDVRTETTQGTLLDIQWGNPYLHFTNGEGIYAMPEVGAKCMVCRPSESPAFVICFGTTFERNQSASADADEALAQPDVSEGEQPQNSNINFSAGRPELQQGDMMIRARDGNQIWVRRGGVIEISSTAVCRRLYIPLLNYIRDLCENYKLQTFGGDMSWTVKRVEDSPDGTAKALFSILAKESAQDEKATVAVKIGEVSENGRLSITVAPDAIDMETMETESSVFNFSVSKEGSVSVSAQKDVTVTITGNLEQTVQGTTSLGYEGGQTVNVTGDQDTTVSGGHKLAASTSEENVSGNKIVSAASISLGSSGASSPVIKGDELLLWITSSLIPALAPMGVVVTPPTPTMLSTKVKVD